MTLAQIKKKLKVLIEAETDKEKLARVQALLELTPHEKLMRKKMQQAAEASERDFKAGRYMDLETFEKDTAAFIDKLFKAKEKGRSAAARKSGVSKAK